MSQQTEVENLDTTREGHWECAVCGAIGPNPDYDTLDDHAQDKHPEKYREMVETGIGQDVPLWPIGAAIVLGVGASVAAFAVTWSLLVATGAYVLTTVTAWTLAWVVGYA